MTKQPFRFTFFLLICFSIPVMATAQTQTVNIPDPNLRTAIENELGKASGAAITVADMESLTQLSALIASVSDLTGLEAATNLTDLNLRGNSISDISPIAELTNLTSLRLNSNFISDISPIAELTNLTVLWLSGNSISNISAVAGLTNLTSLQLESNSISDISAVAGLTNLRALHLASNDITDISAVAGLTSLTSLRLNSNFISDLSPLVENTGLGSGDWVNVKINLLNAASINTHIPALQRRGVTVEFDNIIVQPGDPDQTVDIPDPVLRAAIGRELGEASGATITGADMARLTSLIRPISFFSSISDLTGLEYAINIVTLGLRGNSISDLSPLSGLTNLTLLSLPENQITDISAVAGLISLTELHLEDNNITDISPLVENTGLGSGDRVDVKGNPLNSLSINTYIPALQSRGVAVQFDDPTPVDIPDPNLRAEIENALGKASGDTITGSDMLTLTRLFASNASISDLTGLERATSLRGLDLEENNITDISAVARLTNLEWLELHNNSISDISPLVENTGLGSGDKVDVRGNPLNSLSINTRIPALQSRGVTVLFDDPTPVDIPDPNLRAEIEHTLGVASGDTITGSDMLTLTELSVPNANISDLTGLERATNLRSLNLGTEFVIMFTTGVVGYFNSNSVSDLSPLAGLINLTELDLEENNISDISALEGLTNLTELSLVNNNISDISALEGLINLTELSLVNNNITDISAVEGLINLTYLWLDSNNITDISPVEGLTNLTRLYLWDNNISDISPVEGLTNLTRLYLGDNNISDISALEGLTNLASLWLSRNSITDISAIAGLINLTRLYLGDNNISNISAVAGLTNLTELSLVNNNITDISAVAGLTSLTSLRLNSNSISDLSPLVENTGLGNGDEVDVRGNPLNSLSINTHIPALQSRVVEVSFDDVIAQLVDVPDPNLRAVIENALGKASGAPITVDEMAWLTELFALNANISNLTGLEYATNLTRLILGAEYLEAEERFINSNSVSDLSPLTGLTNLTQLWLDSNNITDISPVEGLINLTYLWLDSNNITDISPVEGLTNLAWLGLGDNSITDISPVEGLTNLTLLYLWGNSISDISPVAGLTNLTELRLGDNSISDISPVEGLINLTELWLENNSITDISPVEGLTNLAWLGLWDNSISDISAVEGLTNLTRLGLWNNSISDLSPVVANTGLGDEDTVDVSENPLNSASIHTHIPTLQSRGVEVLFENLKPTTLEYLLSIPAGISLIHVPLKVTTVDGIAKTIESIADLYDALGGADTVNFLITYDSQTQEWRSYFGTSDTGTPADKGLTDDTGIIAGMKVSTSVRLSGDALGTDGSSTIALSQGLNLVGLPLRDSRVMRVSDLFALDGIAGNVPVIVLTNDGEFKAVGRAEDPGDIEITGGQSFILTAQRAATVAISGEAWTNVSGAAAAPPVAMTGIEVGDMTPVLGLRGAIVDEEAGLKVEGFRVIVKNLSTGRAVAAITGHDEAGYRSTVVDIKTGRAATVGDILEISARSPNPFIGVKPLRYTVTAEDVKRSRIQLPTLVAYEIPAETQLLPNYPNPFNPETWIPYRLAKDAFVTLTIYDGSGRVVRTLDVGHQVAAVYESRSKAVYWDGRNEVGEQVASGVYFYHLSAGDYSATRKMLILK